MTDTMTNFRHIHIASEAAYKAAHEAEYEFSEDVHNQTYEAAHKAAKEAVLAVLSASPTDEDVHSEAVYQAAKRAYRKAVDVNAIR